MLGSITRWSNAIAFFACIATFSFAYLGFADNADFGFDPEEFLTRLFDIVLKEKKSHHAHHVRPKAKFTLFLVFILRALSLSFRVFFSAFSIVRNLL